MLPLDLFASRQFSAANVVTFVVYAALGAALFLLVLNLQQVLDYSPLAAGAALFPLTVLMLLLSARAGRLATRIGPRLPMTLGPVLAGGGLALLTRAVPGTGYVDGVLPGVIVFGLGLSLTVAPLTATVLAAADERHAGIASGVNNAVARVAGLVAVAALPPLAGLTGAAYTDPDVFSAGYRRGLWMAAGLCAAGGLLAFATIRKPIAPVPTEAAAPELEPCRFCGVEGPPMAPGAQRETEPEGQPA